MGAVLLFIRAFLLWWALGVAALAQQTHWIQVEAHPTRADAFGRAPDFAASFDDVAVFALPSGWHAIALGPQTREAARGRLRELLAAGRIPPDSYIVSQGRYVAQVWPAEGGASLAVAAAAETAVADVPTEEAGTNGIAAPNDEVATGIDPADIQRALIWYGYDPGQVDGVLGPASRIAFANWQVANGGAAAAELVARWRSEEERAGLAAVIDGEAGLALDLPLALLQPEGRAAPFVRYAPRVAESGVRLFVVSLRDSPRALTDILGGLGAAGMLPPAPGPITIADGRLSLRRPGAALELDTAGGALRGFAMAWPAGPAEGEMGRIAAAVARSLRPIGTRTLPAESAPVDPQLRLALDPATLDLVPPRLATGVRLDTAGTVLTVAAAVTGCARVTLDGNPARVTAIDPVEGLALVLPLAALPDAERRFARLELRPPLPGGGVIIAGLAPGGPSAQPAAGWGILLTQPDVAGTGRLKAEMLAQDAGAAVIDGRGAMAGLLSASSEAAGEARYLGAERIAQWLRAKRQPFAAISTAAPAAAPAELVATAAAIAAEVGCAP